MAAWTAGSDWCCLKLASIARSDTPYWFRTAPMSWSSECSKFCWNSACACSALRLRASWILPTCGRASGLGHRWGRPRDGVDALPADAPAAGWMRRRRRRRTSTRIRWMTALECSALLRACRAPQQPPSSLSFAPESQEEPDGIRWTCAAHMAAGVAYGAGGGRYLVQDDVDGPNGHNTRTDRQVGRRAHR
eukprot:scaffold1136_cov101-Isochrysis_galbana.AAC.2